MTWTTPSVFTVGQVLRALDMNNIGTDLTFLYNQAAPIYDSTLGADGVFDTGAASIPATYVHLRGVLYGRTDRAATTDGVKFQFNADTGNNYDSYAINVNATSPVVSLWTEQVAAAFVDLFGVAGSTAPANVFSTFTFDIAHYAGTTNHKDITGGGHILAVASAGNQYIGTGGGRWRSTAAISRIKVFPSLGTNFKAGTRLSIYGTSLYTG